MTYTFIDLKDFLENIPNPSESNLDSFKKALIEYNQKNEANKNNTEEFQKNNLIDFLKTNFYYELNTKDRIDLAIYDDEKIKCFFEIKSQSNKNEFPKTLENPESKAFYEAILYYLRERNQHKNNNISKILLSNTQEFFIFEAKEFEIFAKDKEILKAYKNCDFKQGNDQTTQYFYKELETLLPNLDLEIKFSTFNLNTTDSAQIALIYKALSPYCLIDKAPPRDANTLNIDFYNELLHILGLKEISKNGKVLIVLNDTPNALSYAIREQFNLDKEKDFETIFQLLTIWNNRILFLRLLESMLKDFKHIGDQFLNIKTIANFSQLDDLFFKVLAKRENERDINKFKDIPYLNSSLFTESECEKQNRKIGSIASKPLEIYANSILKKKKDFKATQLPLLEYLFEFLSEYDFTTTPKDIKDYTKINHDKLINSAVLGLVFEKLNGYKEGSFYTPSFITNYMCKESITKVVIDKFNEKLSIKAENIKDLHNAIKDTKTALEIFYSIKICDPSVGSGHFLVSSLNQMILIQHQLGLLFDTQGYRLKDIELSLENDEILIKDLQNQIHSYSRPAHKSIESHRIQEAIFNAKRQIIESCLFGVDINPTSCEISKLRLWIELLKYSYYKDIEKGYLETLPNIDINIKCGNSLIGYFNIKENLNHIPNIKERIDRYKKLVENYKEGLFNDKTQIDKEIKDLQTAFKNFCFKLKNKDALLKLQNLCNEYSSKYGDYLAKDDAELRSYVPSSFSSDLFGLDEEKAKIDFKNLKEKYTQLYNLDSYKPFEWRFEFPEVLDEKGNFLGFDLIIGNPPYIRQESIKYLKGSLEKGFEIFNSTSDIYTYFYELAYKVLSKSGTASFITSNKYTRAKYGENLRTFLLKNTTILSYTELNGIKVFDKATVDTSILSFQKQMPNAKSCFFYTHPKSKESLETNQPQEKIKRPQSILTPESFIFLDDKALALKEKIESIGTPLKEWDISINYGIKTGYNEAFIIDTATKERILNNCKSNKEKKRTSDLIKPILRGKDIKRYSYQWAGLWLINTHNGYTDSELKKIPPINIKEYPALKAFLDSYYPQLEKRTDKGDTPYNLRHCAYLEEFAKPKISWQRVTKEVSFILENENFLLDSMAFLTAYSLDELHYLLATLNSKAIFWYFKQIGHLYSDSGFLLSNQYVERLPIPTHKNTAQIKQIESLAKQILDLKAKDSTANTKTLENKLDNLIYDLYGLSKDERKLVESEITSGGGAELIETIYTLANTLTKTLSNTNNTKYEGKIIWAEMTNEPCFVYEENGMFINQTCYFIPHANKYLLGILNSKLIYFYMQQIATNLGEGAMRWIKQYIEKLPIPKITEHNQSIANKLIALSEQILQTKAKDSNANTESQEKEIDLLVYKLYGLTKDEIKIIES